MDEKELHSIASRMREIRNSLRYSKSKKEIDFDTALRELQKEYGVVLEKDEDDLYKNSQKRSVEKEKLDKKFKIGTKGSGLNVNG